MIRIEITYSKKGVTKDWHKILVFGRTKKDKRQMKKFRKKMRRYKNPMEDLKI